LNSNHIKEIMKKGGNIREYFKKKYEEQEAKKKAHAEVLATLRKKIKERYVLKKGEIDKERKPFQKNIGSRFAVSEPTQDTTEQSVEVSEDEEKKSEKLETSSSLKDQI